MVDGKWMMKLNVIYEDNHLILVEKPVNILSQSDITGDMDMISFVKSYLKEKYHKPGNVYLGLLHRLDRPVGGLMLFAKTSKAAARMTSQIEKHLVKKTYLAIVLGKVSPKNGVLKDYLKRLSNGNTIVASKDHGKYAELSYTVLDYKKEENVSFVEIELKTGRHHQIRVQFSSRGFPLCGDQRYGRKDQTQIALYAYQLEFIHPITKEVMKFENFPKGGYWTMFTM